MENTTKKIHKPSLFRKTRKFIRKTLNRTKRFIRNVFEATDDAFIETLYPEAIKNKALKKEYLKLLSLRTSSSLTNLDTVSTNITNSTINSATLSPIETEILKRINLIIAKEKAKTLRKAYRKHIVAEKFKNLITVNPDKEATQPIVCAVKSNPIPAPAYSEVTPTGEKPIFQANQNKNQTITLQNYYQNTRE